MPDSDLVLGLPGPEPPALGWAAGTWADTGQMAWPMAPGEPEFPAHGPTVGLSAPDRDSA